MRGVVGIVFGVVAMAAPLETVLALALLWGLWALVDGAGAIAQAFKARQPAPRWTLVLTGLVSFTAAFLAIVRPGLTAVGLTWILGIWLVARGALEVALAAVDDRDSRWGLAASGVIDIVLGVLFMANPGRAAVSIALVLGLTALVWGIVLCGLAVWVRRTPATHRAEARDPMPT
nr:DUF308 domain-containing protein [Nocardioides lijunqiniae]